MVLSITLSFTLSNCIFVNESIEFNHNNLHNPPLYKISIVNAIELPELLIEIHEIFNSLMSKLSELCNNVIVSCKDVIEWLYIEVFCDI